MYKQANAKPSICGHWWRVAVQLKCNVVFEVSYNSLDSCRNCGKIFEFEKLSLIVNFFVGGSAWCSDTHSANARKNPRGGGGGKLYPPPQPD